MKKLDKTQISQGFVTSYFYPKICTGPILNFSENCGTINSVIYESFMDINTPYYFIERIVIVLFMSWLRIKIIMIHHMNLKYKI